jgi:hypothetical protein
VAVRAKFPVIELLLGKLTAVAWIARLVSVIVPDPVASTVPLVLRARVEVPDGAIA